MFGKKPAEGPNRADINLKFRTTLRNLKRSLDEYDQRIEQELANAVAYRKQGNLGEEQRCMKKVQRLLASKIQKEKFYDNVELVKERIDDILDKVEVSRTLKDTYSSIDNLVDSKEMKSILGQLDSFNKQFSKANNMMDAFMGSMDASVEQINVDPSYAASVQNMVDERMKGYEERVEAEATGELTADSFNLN